MAGQHKNTEVTRLGRDPFRVGGAINMPVDRTSTVVFNRVAELDAAKKARFDKGQVFYGRFGTPSIFAFEDAVTELEGGYGTVAVPSGLAACVLPLVALLKPGDHVLVTDSVYEPARASISSFIARSGVEVTYYNPRIGAGIEALFRANTRLVYLESPGSMTFEIQDIPAISKIARARGAVTICDNTWATALFHKPLLLGADISFQSATKYIGGHSDVMLGLVTCGQEYFRMLREAANWMGYRVAPDDVFLAARGLRTLAVRLDRQFETGLALASWLETLPLVSKVIHPALPSSLDHELWNRDFSGASGLFAIMLDTQSPDVVVRFVEELKLFGLGFSWGGFESLVLHGDPAAIRTATRWDEPGALVRIYAGLEHVDDLKTDLEQAFVKAFETGG